MERNEAGKGRNPIKMDANGVDHTMPWGVPSVG